MGQPLITRDSAGNLREVNVPANGKPIAIGGGTAHGFTIAAAATGIATVAAVTGSQLVVDFAKVCICSIAASTSVLVTLSDTTNTLGVYAFSANGEYNIINSALSGISISGASGKAITLTATTAGTGGTVALDVYTHKVLAADV